jgi:hypothetical protein
MTAPETTEVRVQCQDSPKLVKNIRGQWWLAMGAGCRASTSSWQIVSKGTEAVRNETVVVSVHTTVTAWTGEVFTAAECHEQHHAGDEGSSRGCQ